MLRTFFVYWYKIQCELSCPKSARKVSGLLRNLGQDACLVVLVIMTFSVPLFFFQQGEVDEVDSSPFRPRKDILTKQYKKKHHGSPIVPPLELYKLQQEDSIPDSIQLSPRERYDGFSTDEALVSPRTRPLTVDTRTIPYECPPSPPHEQIEHSWFERRLV